MGAEKTPDQDRDSNGREQEDSFVRAWGLLARFLDDHTLSDASSVERFIAEHPADERALREMLRNFHTNRVRNDRDDDDDDAIAADDGGDSDPTPALVDLLHRIRADIGAATRYTRGERIGSGGVGVVFKLWDANLRRNVAKKTIRVDKLRPDSVERFRWIARFLEEAQITAQLDHPGIVPVHDMGFEPDGQVYFTMRYVRGDTFADALDKARAGNDGWNRTRAVSTLLRVCETMAFAHGKDVIHRDLKPSNIMVGRYGETYVMDWGLARKLGKPDLRDLRIRPPQAHSTDVVTDARRPENAGLFTVDGHALGTPTYMSPEQARGEIDHLGKPTDIYALGAILYEILAGHPPYAEPGVRAPAETICRWVIDGPPAKLHTRAPDAPAELVAICERAMARDPDRRYPSVDGMADDLRAFLEHRVVKAYRTGPITELTKWVGRNRLVAAIAVALLFVAVSGAYLVALEQARRVHVETLAADIVRLEALTKEGESLPCHGPGCIERMTDWLRAFDDLSSRREDRERRYLELRGLVGAGEAPRNLNLSSLVSMAETRLERFESTADEFRRTEPSEWELERTRLRSERDLLLRQNEYNSTPESGTANDQREFVQLGEYLGRLTVATWPESGIVARMRARIEKAKQLEQTAPASDETLIRSFEEKLATDTRYAGSSLARIPGLRPLRVDPDSGLLEFWYEPSGARPEPGPGDRLIIRAETALVFVYVPAGRVKLGLQSEDPRKPAYYRQSKLQVDRRFDRAVGPLLASKYELTQAQWRRLSGRNPSKYRIGQSGYGTEELVVALVSPTHPAERISRDDLLAMLPVWGMTLPTLVEWTRLAEGWDGDEVHEPPMPSIEYANFYDFSATTPDIFKYHAPVDALTPNALGFYHTIGNVAELVLDPWPPFPEESELTLRDGRWIFKSTLAAEWTRCGYSFVTVRPTKLDSFFSTKQPAPAYEGAHVPSEDTGARPVMIWNRSGDP